MGRSDESKAHQREYDKTMTRFFGLKLNKKTDSALIRWLDIQPSVQTYLKRIIAKDMMAAEPVGNTKDL